MKQYTLRLLTFPVLFSAIASLLAGVLGGLLRLGVDIPYINHNLALNHGTLMISCFLGTLISLERARGIDELWAYTAPWLTGAGAILALTGTAPEISGMFVTAGSIFLILIFAKLAYYQTSTPTVVMGLGAVSWFAGNILWVLGFPLMFIIPWWVSFLILTIAAERLQLSRIIRNTRNVRLWFISSVTFIFAGTVATLFSPGAGLRVTAAGMLLLALWLLRNDIAWKTARKDGLPRFIGLCLIAGYIWLAAGSSLALIDTGMPGIYFDTVLHSVLLGFVFSMIFAHAPVIFPSVLGLSVRYIPAFYIHAVLLHSSLLVRTTGDLAGWQSIREAGGAVNAAAVFFFIIITVLSVITGFRKKSAVTAG